MRVLLTGATGFIGSRIVPELIAAGHEVIGMTRSDAGVAALARAGVTPHRATLENLDSIRAGVEHAEAVVHTAFDHNFATFAANTEKDRRVIGAMGEVLKGSARPLVITSGTGMGATRPGMTAIETLFDAGNLNPRSATEKAGAALSEQGIDVRVMRLPQVHDTLKQGLITPYIAIAREKGIAAYVADGANRWPAAHVLDVAKLYQLVLDRGHAGARYHAVAEEGIAVRDIVEAIGQRLKLPVKSISAPEAPAYFGWLAMFAALDLPASSAQTRRELGWQPAGRGMIADLEQLEIQDP